MIRRPPRSTQSRSSAASDVYKRQGVDHWSAIPRSDGLATDRSGIVLCILTADCLPLVMVCGTARAVAVAHVGWRGALYGVTVSAISRLLEYTGCRTEEITAVSYTHLTLPTIYSV